MRATVKDDIIIVIQEEHNQENNLIEHKIKEITKKKMEEAFDGAYQKPRAVYSGLVDNIVNDPATKMGLGRILHCFLFNHFFNNITFSETAVSHKSFARTLQRKRKD